ncbi:hypothetical protein F2Q69_00009678 [Brassica cretica]|uniref:Uncharacterized protein n=1 Tax=Brassica cretica TaxID=69181 RepID=A0A8S9PD56_BRACR|nr:hypothetical protein F2Q69_00009678 [Brassica cretica]
MVIQVPGLIKSGIASRLRLKCRCFGFEVPRESNERVFRLYRVGYMCDAGRKPVQGVLKLSRDVAPPVNSWSSNKLCIERSREVSVFKVESCWTCSCSNQRMTQDGNMIAVGLLTIEVEAEVSMVIIKCMVVTEVIELHGFEDMVVIVRASGLRCIEVEQVKFNRWMKPDELYSEYVRLRRSVLRRLQEMQKVSMFFALASRSI